MEDLVPPGVWYQEATINGVKMRQRRYRDTSQYRWETLIEPLLPFRDGTDRRFVELGSNAGFYLRKMADLGFSAIGVEREKEFYDHAMYWENNDPKGTLTLHTVLNDYRVPSCQVLLLAQVHYWLTRKEISRLMWKLRRVAMHVIVVGRHRPMRAHRSDCRIEPLRGYFKGWVEGETTENQKHFGVIFKNSRLVEKETGELGFYQQLMKSKRLLPAFDKLINDVISGEVTGLCKRHPYYRYLQWRGDPLRDRRFIKKVNLIKSVYENGLIKPLQIGREIDGKLDDRQLYDGDHRYMIARNLGISKIICWKRPCLV